MNIFNDPSIVTHMPFIFEGEKVLFCSAPSEDHYLEQEGVRALKNEPLTTMYQPYQVWIGDYDPELDVILNPVPIGKDGPDGDQYCSPHAWRDDQGLIHLTYIKMLVGGMGKLKYGLYERIGEDFDSLGGFKRITDTLGLFPYCGFENEKYRAVANTVLTNTFFNVYDKAAGEEVRIKVGGTSIIRRISFLSEDPDEFLITYPTGSIQEGGYYHFKTIQYNIISGEAQEVLCDAGAMYKCSVWGDKAILADNTRTVDQYDMQLKFGSIIYKNAAVHPQIVSRLKRPLT